MAKAKTSFICQSCGAVYSRWNGRCDSCGGWNTLVEERLGAGVGAAPKSASKTSGQAVELVSLDGAALQAERVVTGIGELDRVVGGGFVTGSAMLIGGDPGIGKSTILLQAAAALARARHKVIYISGEEAIDQVRLRAERLGLEQEPVLLAAETHVEDILATLAQSPGAALVIIDSIQTLWTDLADSAPGTVTQVRSSAQALIRYAKQSGAAVVLVGHVTKDGQIAGPRVVEHMVDAVLYFEGDGAQSYRLLRGVKNRFGPTDEIGVFEMTGEGLREVTNPSELFLGDRDSHSAGAAVFAGMEGSRPLLVEIQALCAQSSLGTPRRTVVGWDGARLAMVIAVLETHCGVRLSGHDIYLNIAGGLRINEPAADLAVAAALISSLTGAPLPPTCLFFGEIGLSGKVRSVAREPARLKEGAHLGFQSAVTPSSSAGQEAADSAVHVHQIDHLSALVTFVANGSDQANAIDDHVSHDLIETRRDA